METRAFYERLMNVDDRLDRNRELRALPAAISSLDGLELRLIEIFFNLFSEHQLFILSNSNSPYSFICIFHVVQQRKRTLA